MDRNDILEAAGRCINGHRAQDYGKPENNFSRIAGLWGIYTGREYTPEQVAVMLALLKVARLGSGRPHPDNYVDLAGYAALAGELAGQAAPEAVGAAESPGEPASAPGCVFVPQEASGHLGGRGGLPVDWYERECMRQAVEKLAREAREALGGAESPQEPRNAPEGVGAFTDCTPLASIKLPGENGQESKPTRMLCPPGPGGRPVLDGCEVLETLTAEEAREKMEAAEAEGINTPRYSIPCPLTPEGREALEARRAAAEKTQAQEAREALAELHRRAVGAWEALGAAVHKLAAGAVEAVEPEAEAPEAVEEPDGLEGINACIARAAEAVREAEAIAVRNGYKLEVNTSYRISRFY